MSNFFRHAPPLDTEQRRFLEAVTQRRNVIASFPLGYSSVSLYALASMMGNGMVVAVCPSSRQIWRNLEYFKQADVRFPDVAFLDDTQMPHEERTVHGEINQNRVKLLYITPERFVSLTFLEVLVHTPINFIVVEEADRLLPQTLGHASYRRFYQDGLQQLRVLPPLVLITPPLPPQRLRELSERLSWDDYQLIQGQPLLASVTVQVCPLFTEHQKFNHLVDQLAGSPGRGRLGRFTEAGATWIQVAYPAQAEKLGASLLDYGFESVGITHYKKSLREQAQVLQVANTRLNAIVVSGGSDVRYWTPPLEASPRLVFWTPPASVDDLWAQVFRQVASMRSIYGEKHRMKGLVLHTKEDFKASLKRLQYSQTLTPEEIQSKSHALKQYRRWALSEGCRLQSLVGYYQGGGRVEVPPCGLCDQCKSNRGRLNRQFQQWRGWLKNWLF